MTAIEMSLNDLHRHESAEGDLAPAIDTERNSFEQRLDRLSSLILAFGLARTN